MPNGAAGTSCVCPLAQSGEADRRRRLNERAAGPFCQRRYKCSCEGVICRANSNEPASQGVRIVVKRHQPKFAAHKPCASLSQLAEMIESDDGIENIAAVPGFDAAHLSVDVLPDAIAIEGARDAGPKIFLGCLHLPFAVQVRKIVARLEDGRLIINAPRQRPAALRTVNS